MYDSPELEQAGPVNRLNFTEEELRSVLRKNIPWWFRAEAYLVVLVVNISVMVFHATTEGAWARAVMAMVGCAALAFLSWFAGWIRGQKQVLTRENLVGGK